VLLGGESGLDAVGEQAHLLHLGDTALAADSAKNLLGLTKVNNINGAAETVLHILDHAANVSDMRALVVDGLVSLILTSKRASETHHAGVLALGLDREHDGGSKLVVGRALSVINLNNMDRVPRTLHGLALLGLVLGLLEEDTGSEAIVKVPAVDGGDTALVVKVTIDVEDIVHCDLHLAQLCRGHGSVGQRGVVLVGPWAAIAIGITVVVAEEVVALLLLVMGDLEGLVNSAKKVLHEVGNEVDETSKVVLQLCRRETTHKVKSTIKLVCHCYGFLLLLL